MRSILKASSFPYFALGMYTGHMICHGLWGDGLLAGFVVATLANILMLAVVGLGLIDTQVADEQVDNPFLPAAGR